MKPPAADPPNTSPEDSPTEESDLSVAEQYKERNFLALAFHSVMIRVGWIFKTESIVVPAFMDAIGSSAFLRSLLPVLNRFGFRISPSFYARRLKLMKQKRRSVFVTSICMGIIYLIFAVLWGLSVGREGDKIESWWAWLFLSLYSLFFICVGLNHLGTSTLQGKLVRATTRGRLMMVQSIIATPLAILCAWFFLRPWLNIESYNGFTWIFAFTGVAFTLSAGCMLFIKEPEDNYTPNGEGILDILHGTVTVLKEDKNFRKLGLLAAVYGTVLMLFPHYFSMGKEFLGIKMSSLPLWVIVQNASTGICTLLVGPFVDKHGNRRALHYTVFGSALSPILAIILAQTSPTTGGNFFWLVFLALGLTPVTVSLFVNYTLELADKEHHPKYIAALGVCSAVPVMVLSPLMGTLIDLVGYEPVFFLAICLILFAGFWTFRLHEPRHHEHQDSPPMPTGAGVS